jgi:hypothetical protein
MELTIREIKEELIQEFSYISGFDLVRLFDYVHNTNFSPKINKKSVNENKDLEVRLRMIVSKILESAEPSSLVDIYQFWKFNRKDTAILFEELDKERIEQNGKFEKAADALFKMIKGKGFDIRYIVDDQNRTISIELFEDGGGFMEVIEFITDEFIDKEFNQNKDWKFIGTQGNIIIVTYNPDTNVKIDDKKPSDKIEYDSEREKTKEVGAWDGSNN